MRRLTGRRAHWTSADLFLANPKRYLVRLSFWWFSAWMIWLWQEWRTLLCQIGWIDLSIDRSGIGIPCRQLPGVWPRRHKQPLRICIPFFLWRRRTVCGTVHVVGGSSDPCICSWGSRKPGTAWIYFQDEWALTPTFSFLFLRFLFSTLSSLF